MNIFHTEWSDDMGGQEKRVLAELVGLADRGHSVALACRAHSKILGEAERLGITVFVLPMRRPYDIPSIIRLVGILRSRHIDVVNTHSGVDSWIGGIAAGIARVPVLVRTRHLNIPLKRSLLNFIHYLPNIYITCGNNMRDNLIDNCGFPSGKVVSIPTGVPMSFFDIKKDALLKLKYGLEKDTIVITNVGILRSVKGHETTLKSVKTVLQTYPAAKFLIVGHGPRRKILEDLTESLGIKEHVIYTGYVEDVREIYSIADVSILSSWSEGIPQSILQAMAAGVPVVATRVGGVPEIVIDESTGILVDPGDSEALARGIIRLLNDRLTAAIFARSARKLIMEKHSAVRMLDDIENLYGRLLHNE